jgi:putative peptidoglycan lipid II flippase
MRDARTPVIVSVIAILANLGLNIWLYRTIGYRGLALGTAIAATINAGLLLWILARRIGGMDGRRVSITLAKILVASAVMGAAAYYSELWLHHLLPQPSVWHRVARVGGAVAAGLGVLTLAAAALRIEEFDVAMRRIFSKLGRGAQ